MGADAKIILYTNHRCPCEKLLLHPRLHLIVLQRVGKAPKVAFGHLQSIAVNPYVPTNKIPRTRGAPGTHRAGGAPDPV